MNLMNKLILILIFLCIYVAGMSQDIRYMSLDQAITFAMENNYDILLAEKDIEAAKQVVIESTSIGLPQLNASVGYNDNIAQPTFILPGEVAGTPGETVEIQFGTNYDASLGATATQLLFSGDYIVGLQAAKKYLEKTNIDFFKNKMAVKQRVAESYYNVLSTEEGLRIVDSTLVISRKLYAETKAVYEVGFAEDIDVDQLELIVSDLEASRTNFLNQRYITQSYLKFYLGLSDNDSLVLTDKMEDLIKQVGLSALLSESFSYKNHVDYVSLKKQKELSYLQWNLEKTAYLPTLSARLNIQTQAQRDSWDFFNNKGKWYPSSVFGVSMNIPIWSSGQRSAKLKQAKIAFEQVEVMERQLVTQLDISYRTVHGDYLNAYSVYENKDRSRKIAEKIYLKTTEKYVHGMASSLDILNTHNQYLTAERDYINASLQLLYAGQQLELILTKSEN